MYREICTTLLLTHSPAERVEKKDSLSLARSRVRVIQILEKFWEKAGKDLGKGLPYSLCWEVYPAINSFVLAVTLSK